MITAPHPTGFSTQNSLVAFDQSGNLKWSVAGDYQPQIATADGGVIAQNFDTGASATFDSNGSPTGQLGSLPTYSWKGAYQLGSIHSVTLPFPNIAPVLGAGISGHPSIELA
jgi:hypothetical protein